MENKTTWFDIVRLTLEEDSVSQAPYRTIEIVGAAALGTLQDEINKYGWRGMVSDAVDWGDGAFFKWYQWYDEHEKDAAGRVQVYALIRVTATENDTEYEFVKLVDLQAMLKAAAEAAT